MWTKIRYLILAVLLIGATLWAGVGGRRGILRAGEKKNRGDRQPGSGGRLAGILDWASRGWRTLRAAATAAMRRWAS